jgi:transketolase
MEATGNTAITSEIDTLCVNLIRVLSAESVQQANSGHPGLPMGAAPMAYVLWSRFLKHNPANPKWADRDRFVLSAGHGSMLLYSLLFLTGYDLTLDDLKAFRQWGSKTPGHPEYGHTPGVETTTGPLGQGLANAVGLAMAETFLAARYNRPGFPVVDHYTYALVSDGDLMEGVSHEAASLAGHLKLGKLICLYDDNHISIEGSTDLAFTEDRLKRFEAYGWQVQQVEDGNDLGAITRAIEAAREEKQRPALIAVRTFIGWGSPNKQNKASAHGEPLGAEEMGLTKANLCWPAEPSFCVPEPALAAFRQATGLGKKREGEWSAMVQSYEQLFPDPARELQGLWKGELPRGWDRDLPVFPADAKGEATRNASGVVLNSLAARLPQLIGGSADLAPSNKTLIKGAGDYAFGQYDQPNIRFGVREHGMGSILNGLALHGGVIPYGGTFLIFSDYMRPPIRLAAMMGQRVIYVFTHDSIGLGEDGPTHQPVEQLAALRAIPNLTVIRPADANETAEAWRQALLNTAGPTALALTRQNVPTLDRKKFNAASGLAKGGYVVNRLEGKTPRVLLIGTGSELSLALEAAGRLEAQGIVAQVVSLPSWGLFDRQPQDYRDQVLPPLVKARVAVEAGSPLGWERYVGDQGRIVGLDHFGASAPYKVLYEKFGITVERVVEAALAALGRGE